MRTHAVTLGAVLAVTGCGSEPRDENAGRVTIDVGALSLPGIVGATYRVSVANGLGAELWQATLTSGAYGDGRGSLAYVGPCDASPGAEQNRVALTLVELRDVDGALTAGVDFVNPAPATDPIVLVRTCAANQDVAATFDLTIARSAQQGFFDVAVAFDDIFCSAKLDCESAPGVPLTLLHDANGTRALTAVVGFACTAGPDAATHLWMDRVVVTCEHGGPFVVDVADGPGNLDPLFDEPTADLLFQSAVYRGSEVLQGWNKAYWNVALGLNQAAFATLGACRVSGQATASDGPLPSGVTPPEARWPIVTWDVGITNTTGQRVCTTHALDDGTGVGTAYSATSGHGFYAGLERATGLITVTGAAPDATSSFTCTSDELPVGAATTCTLIPRKLGQPIATASGNFQLSAPSGTLSPLTPSFGTSFTFTFTAATSAATPIDSGIGLQWPMVVTATPDGTSALTCADATLAVGGTTTCTITANQAGGSIYAQSFAFDPRATAGDVTALAADPAPVFTFTFTAPATTGPVTIGDGINVTTVVVTDTPDATSTLSCADDILNVGIPTTCTIEARRNGTSITTHATSFTPTTTAGTVSAPTPPLASTFTFTLTAPATTGPITVGDGLHTFPITVVATADLTSTLTCADTELLAGAQTICTITPKLAGATIYARASEFTAPGLAPAASNTFTFTFTAPATTGPTTVDVGLTTTSVTVHDIPDETSTLTCADDVVNVGIPTICTITPKRADVPITALATSFTPTTTAGTVTPAAPALASTFTFTFTAPAITGPVTVGDSKSTFPITVVATPDATSTVTCAASQLLVSTQTTCTITPKLGGATIYARASAFTPPGLAPAAADTFTFTYTAPTATGPTTVDVGLTTTSITVYDIPDQTSTLTCADSVLNVGIPTICTITPKRAGIPITALATSLTPTTTAGTVTPAAPALASTFTFTFTAPTTTGPVTIGDSKSTFPITVVATPDATSTLTCATTQLLVGAQTTCTITPKLSGATIYARASAFTPPGLAPAAADTFTFTYTAPTATGPTTVDVGLTTTSITVYDIPDQTSTLTCADSVLNVGIPTTCTITPKRAGVSITALATSLTPTATAGTVTPAAPPLATTFTFTFTAPTTTGPVTIGDGLHTFPITVIDTPDATSTLSCTTATPSVSSATTCTVTPKKGNTTIYAAASTFPTSATGGSTSPASPTIANTFTFTFTAPATSGPVTINAAALTFAITVVAAPDASSTLTCAATQLLASAATTCTITPRSGGVGIHALASAFTTSATGGSTTAPAPTVGTSFTFTYTAPTTTGPITVNDSRHTFAITIYDTPDGTSLISCSPSSIPGAATSTCTIAPRKNGTTIYALAAAFAPSANAGSMTAASPALAAAFTTTFTAPRAAQVVTVSGNPGSTTVTVTSSCSDGFDNGTETDVDCGGSCGACAAGKECTIAADCQSGFCGADNLCADGCPLDPNKTVPGLCGCGVSDTPALRLGGTSANPAHSCTDVQDEGQACGDRSYWIDPNGGAISDAFEVYCDMTSDGGAWMKIESAHFPHWFTAGNYLSLNAAAPSSANYSIVGTRNNFVDANGCFELRVEVGDSGSWLDAPTTRTVWKQCHDPFTQTTNGADYTFIAGESPTTCAGFNGLHHKYQGNSYTSDPDTGDSINCWWMQIVPHTRYQDFNGYLDGYGGPGGFHLWQSLWVRSVGHGGREQPATTCDALFADQIADDGAYWLDPNGGANSDAFTAYCDMTASAGWTRLEAAHYPFFFNSGNYTSYQPTALTATNYSMLSRLAQFASGGCWTFRIQAGESGNWLGTPDQTTAWRQCHDPFTQKTNGSDYTFVSGVVPTSCGGFNGLHNSVQTFMYTSDADSTDAVGCWGMQTVPHTDYPGNGGYYDGYGGNHMHQWQTLWVK